MSQLRKLKKRTEKILKKWKYLVVALICALCFQFLLEPKIPGILIYVYRHTQANGAYDYVYYPKDNFTGYSYDLIRHAATTYVLASYLHDHQILTSFFIKNIRNSLAYLMSHQSLCEPYIKNSPVCLTISTDLPTLGANAFTILALNAGMQLDGITSDEKQVYLQKMILFEKYLSATFHKNTLIFPPQTDPISKRYQEGQVLLAWSALYNATGDISYLQKAKLLRDEILARLTTTKDYKLHHWFWLGLQELHRVTGEALSQKEREYLTHSANQALSLKITEKGSPLYGTFTKEDPDTLRTDSSDDTDDPLDASSFAVRIEGLGTLFSLLSLGNTACSPITVCKNLHDGIRDASKPFNTIQINAIDILNGFAIASFGGIPARQKDSMIQIDYLQHALSAYLVIQKYK